MDNGNLKKTGYKTKPRYGRAVVPFGSWTPRDTPSDAIAVYLKVIWAPSDSLFMAAGVDAGTKHMMRSADGETWNSCTLTNVDDMACIAHDGSTFVAPARSAARVHTSANGSTWGSSVITSKAYWSCHWSPTNSLFIGGTGNGEILTAPAGGTTWTSRGTPVASLWRQGVTGAAYEVIVGSGGKIAISANGTTGWTVKDASEACYLSSVAYNPLTGTLIAVAQDGTDRIQRSIDDGVTWSGITPPHVITWQAIDCCQGIWFAVGFGSAVGEHDSMYSLDDGLTWAAHPMPASKGYRGICNNGSRFVVVTSGATPDQAVTLDIY